MKKLFLLICLSSLIFCGCDYALDEASAIVFFSAMPITKASFKPDMVENTFEKGVPIYFCVYSDKPINASAGRIQIIQKESKAPNLGFSLYQAKDILLEPEKNYATGSFTVYSKGFYLLRVFKKTQPKTPIAQNTFWISE